MPLIAGKIVNIAVGVTSLKDGDHEAGWRRVDDTAERDALPGEARKRGMVVYVNDIDRTYQLITPTVTSPPQSELDDNGNWLDITAAGGGGVSADDVLESITLTCLASVAIGDVVYVAGSGTADKAVAGIASQTEEAIGIVRSTPNSTTCIVVSAGPVSAFGSLVVGDRYFSNPAVAGGITNVAPTTLGQRSQIVGLATTLSVLFVSIRPAVDL